MNLREELKNNLQEHPFINRTGMILLLFFLLMSVIFMWDQERRNNLTPAERDYQIFKDSQ
mgnify:CR=1 FL=1